jgi:DNA-binding ferritin-like protein
MNKSRNAAPPSVHRETMAALMADVHIKVGERVSKAIKKMPGAEDFGMADLLTDTLRSLELQFSLLKAHINRQQP